MNRFVFLLSVFIVISYANAQYQLYYDGGLYPNYPNYPITDGRSPNSADNRLFWAGLTSTTTTTTTTTTTCTISKAVCTGGRRKRFLEDDEEEIIPSPVNPVETTEVTEIDLALARKERKANPQFVFWRGGFDQPSYELRSTFGEVGQRTPFLSYNPFMRRPIMAADPRFLLYYLTTTTSTSTITATFRSTPICSQGSGFDQC